MNFQKWRRDNFLDLSKLAHKSQAQKVKELVKKLGEDARLKKLV
jgi:hypothetical protein